MPADSPPLISGKCQGLPCSSRPALSHLSRFPPSSLSPPCHMPQRAPRTQIPSKCSRIWVHSPPDCPSGRAGTVLVLFTAPAQPLALGRPPQVWVGKGTNAARAASGAPATLTSMYTQYACAHLCSHTHHTCICTPVNVHCVHTPVCLFPVLSRWSPFRSLGPLPKPWSPRITVSSCASCEVHVWPPDHVLGAPGLIPCICVAGVRSTGSGVRQNRVPSLLCR